jgi:hypothetical protein
MIFSAAVLPALEGWDVLAETAQDLAILSLGATGAVFDNPRVEQAFESHAALVALGLMAANLIFSAIVVYMRAKRAKVSGHFSFFGGIIALFLGVLTLVCTAGVLVWAYRRS